jgi:hypothetical protein
MSSPSLPQHAYAQALKPYSETRTHSHIRMHTCKHTHKHTHIHQTAADLLEGALLEAQEVLQALPSSPPPAVDSCRSSASSGTAPCSNAVARLLEVWAALCFLQHVLFDSVAAPPTSSQQGEDGGACSPVKLAASMQVCVYVCFCVSGVCSSLGVDMGGWPRVCVCVGMCFSEVWI